MAETEGKMLTCDLCGATVFLKYVGDGKADGGFTKWRKYEDIPDGWGSWHVGDIIHSFLCPDCNQRMQDALLACISEIRGKADQDG